MRPFNLMHNILFDFIKEMPHGIVRDDLTYKDLEEIIDNFMKAHGLGEEEK